MEDAEAILRAAGFDVDHMSKQFKKRKRHKGSKSKKEKRHRSDHGNDAGGVRDSTDNLERYLLLIRISKSC